MKLNSWFFYNPVQIFFGNIENLAQLTKFNNILLITSSGFVQRGVVKKILQQLPRKNIILWDKVMPNPTLDELDKAIKELRLSKIDQIVCIGGGSVIDTAKIFSNMLLENNKLTLHDIFRKGKVNTSQSRLPLIAIPTTSGSGSEISPYATLWDKKNHKKYSMSGDQMYPDVALLDPSLTTTLDLTGTLFPALDTISHSLESIWNKNKTPISEIYAIKSLEISIKELENVLSNLNNLSGRKNLQLASLLAGVAISQTQTALAHAISYPLTLHYDVPHGLASSFFLTDLIKYFTTQKPHTKYKKIMNKTSLLLQKLNLGNYFVKYIKKDEVLLLVDEMLNPERVKNYELDLPDIKKIINLKKINN